MNKSRTTRWILLVLAAAALGYFGWHRFHGESRTTAANSAKNAPRAVRVTVAPVEKADFPVYLTGLGTVQAFNTVVVRSRVDGQIDKIAFKEGQLVNQGDLLAEIDPRPYQATLDQAKAKKEQDEANLANTNLDLQRYIKLGEFATRQQLDTQRSTVSQLTAQIAADAAAISNAATQLDYTTIKAPISGVVGLRQVDIGNIVNAATQSGIVTITQIEPITVIFTAPEEQLPYINEAQAVASLKTIAITTDGKKPLAGEHWQWSTIRSTPPAARSGSRPCSRTRTTRCGPASRSRRDSWCRRLKGATVIPDDAIQHGTDGLYAFLVNQETRLNCARSRSASR